MKKINQLRRLPARQAVSKRFPFAYQLIEFGREARIAEYGTKSLALLLALMLSIDSANARPGPQEPVAQSETSSTITPGPGKFTLSDNNSSGFVVRETQNQLRAPRATLPLKDVPAFPNTLPAVQMGCTFTSDTVTCPLVTKVGINASCSSTETQYLKHICVANNYDSTTLGLADLKTVAFPLAFLQRSSSVLKTKVTVTVEDADHTFSQSLQTTLAKVAVVLNAKEIGWVKVPSLGKQSCDEGSASGLPNWGILLSTCGESRAEIIAQQVLVAAVALLLIAAAPEVISGDALDILSWVPAGSDVNPEFVFPAFVD